MATRASLARNAAPKEVYEGRVHKWERRWLVHKKGTVKTEVMLELLRWIVTDEQSPELTGPRHPHIKPLKRPVIKQPSKKPAEQAGEQPGERDAGQANEQGPGPRSAPSAAAAAAAQQPPSNLMGQPGKQSAADQPTAIAPVNQAPGPAEAQPSAAQEPQPSAQEPQPPAQEPQAQAVDEVVENAPVATTADTPQGAGAATHQPQEVHDAAAVDDDPRVTGATADDPAAGAAAAEQVQVAAEGGAEGAAAPMVDGGQAPSEAPLAAAQDVEMAKTSVAL